MTQRETICSIIDLVDALDLYFGSPPRCENDQETDPDGDYFIASNCQYEDVGYTYYDDLEYYYLGERVEDYYETNIGHPDTLRETDFLHYLRLVTCADNFERTIICELHVNSTEGVITNICYDSETEIEIDLKLRDLELIQLHSNEFGEDLDCSSIPLDRFADINGWFVCQDNCFDEELDCSQAAQEWYPLSEGLGETAEVLDIQRTGDKLLVGGYLLKNIGVPNEEESAAYLFDGEKFCILGNEVISTGSAVHDFLVDGNDIYVAGDLNPIGGDQQLQGVVKLVDGIYTPIGDGIPGEVQAIELHDGVLYAGGTFQRIDGDSQKSNLLKWTGSAWVPVGGGVDGHVNALESRPEGLYVGGTFFNVDVSNQPIESNALALWDGTSWQPVTGVGNTGPGRNTIINKISYSNGLLYLAGRGAYSSGNAIPSQDIQTFNPTTNVFYPLGLTTVGPVFDIAFVDSDIFIAGWFDLDDTSPMISNLARFNGETNDWVGLGESTFADRVGALYADGNQLYVGGRFINGDDQPDIDGIGRYSCEVDSGLLPGCEIDGGEPFDCMLAITDPDAGIDEFYSKQVIASGIRIVGSSQVADAAFCVAYDIVKNMTDSISSFFQSTLTDNIGYVIILAEEEVLSQLPEYQNLADDFPAINWISERAVPPLPDYPNIIATSEENLLCQYSNHPLDDNTLVYNFSLAALEYGVLSVLPDYYDGILFSYTEAISNGLWENTNASVDPSSYWAEGAQSYFQANAESSPADGQHNYVDTREELQQYDVSLFNQVRSYFNTSWTFSCRPLSVSTSTSPNRFPLVKVFPNPTDNLFHISSLSPVTNLRCYDAYGRLVFSSTNYQSVSSISVADWIPGLYILSGEASGKIFTRRLVVN